MINSFELREGRVSGDVERKPNQLPRRGNADWNHFSAEEQKAFLNRLGNQVLLPATVNSKLGNSSYVVKKPALAAADFSLTKEAAKHASWGMAEIIARQQRLAELALKTWPTL